LTVANTGTKLRLERCSRIILYPTAAFIFLAGRAKKNILFLRFSICVPGEINGGIGLPNGDLVIGTASCLYFFHGNSLTLKE
jgi:hypothetical protein